MHKVMRILKHLLQHPVKGGKVKINTHGTLPMEIHICLVSLHPGTVLVKGPVQAIVSSTQVVIRPALAMRHDIKISGFFIFSDLVIMP